MSKSKKTILTVWILLMVVLQASKDNFNQLYALQLTNGSAYLPFVGIEHNFLETFDGNPASPKPFRSNNWDITVHSRDIPTWDTLEPMQAAHGPDCSPSPNKHQVRNYQDAVYICKNHMMTAMNASGYGVIYLTPNHMVDFSKGEAVISFDMSTARTSSRDWVDIWITPYEDNLQLPLQDWLPDLNGEPRRGILIEMGVQNEKTIFQFKLIKDFYVFDLPIDAVSYEDFLQTSAMRRDRFELRISKNRVRFGMPDYKVWFIDKIYSVQDWNTGIVQIGHHSYTPDKDCSQCSANTWHWDNISIKPSIPFTIIAAKQRVADEKNGSKVNFNAPAPSNAHLRFSGIGNNLEVSFNNGQTWLKAKPQTQERYNEGVFWSYWMPVPANTTNVYFRGQSWWGGDWRVQDISFWSLESNKKK